MVEQMKYMFMKHLKKNTTTTSKYFLQLWIHGYFEAFKKDIEQMQLNKIYRKYRLKNSKNRNYNECVPRYLRYYNIYLPSQ